MTIFSHNIHYWNGFINKLSAVKIPTRQGGYTCRFNLITEILDKIMLLVGAKDKPNVCLKTWCLFFANKYLKKLRIRT